MIFGYARVSTDDQNLSLQIDALTHYGIDKLFQEKVTGAKKDRPQLEEMINLLREGDSVVIYKLDRISLLQTFGVKEKPLLQTECASQWASQL